MSKIRIHPEVKRKCFWLAIGFLLLVLILAVVNRLKQKADDMKPEPEETQERQTEETADESETVPIPIYNGRIRVLIKTKGYEGLYHEVLEIKSQEKSWKFVKEADTYYLNGEPLEREAFPLILEEEEGSKTVESLQRSYGSPSLEGILEIYGTEQGFVLINDLPLEAYLKYVVPSEMPASYELEALKAQAVCARTYALMQMQSYAYPDFLAHVDDSVSYQVYQNLDQAETANQAVLETADQILTYEGQVINAYYFSTSWGHTSNEDIWWAGDSSKTPYLQGKSIDVSGERQDLTTEEAFEAFLNEPSENCYDSSISWYRWNTNIDVDTLSGHLNGQLQERYNANKEAILTKRAGRFVSVPIKNIGTIQGITVLERGEGGVLQKIEIQGSRRTIQVSTEYNIRVLLNVQGKPIYRHDGSEVTGGALLPSGYFCINPEYDGEKVTGFIFEGGGFGHGVGMSQNGANQMAKEGMGYEEILKFFYTGVDLTSVSAL